MNKKNSSGMLLVAVIASIGFTTCDIDRSKYERECLAEKHLQLYRKNISISFSLDFDSTSLNSVELYHIREGQISQLSYNRQRSRLYIDSIDLDTKDSIMVRMHNPTKEYVLHDFRNRPKYGGKNFLGCYLFLFKVNEKDSVLEDWSRIHIPNDQKSVEE